MSLSNRRRDLSPSRGGVGSSKLRMDRQPAVARITDPSLPIGKRKEIDNVMKKARAGSTNEYWDKKLLEAEEKDPNRWRHSGYKKMYIEDESSSDSANEAFRYNRNRTSRSRSRSRNRKSPPTSPMRRCTSPSMKNIAVKMKISKMKQNVEVRRQSPIQRRRSPRSPDLRRPRSPERRPRTPPSPILKRRSPPMKSHPQRAIIPRSKRPPSPPPKGARTPSNSSVSSCSDDSCSVCSPKPKRGRSRSLSPTNARPRHGPRSPPPKTSRAPAPIASINAKRVMPSNHALPTSSRAPHSRGVEEKQKLPPIKHRIEDKTVYPPEKVLRADRNVVPRHMIDPHAEMSAKHKSSRSGRSRSDVPEDPRLKVRPPEPMEPVSKKSNEKSTSDKLRAKVKIEGEKRKKNESSESDSDSSENSLPTLTATTRLTLSERFGKMAQWKWSVDRSNLENMNMRITKDSTGGALKVMIEEGLQQSPPQHRRYSYSPAPVGHFPEELATTAPTGLMSWDDVRVRYEYYKSRGYLRDLDLKDYVKWEEWWYRYQEWLKQERYYEFYERQQMHRRRRKKIPISQSYY